MGELGELKNSFLGLGNPKNSFLVSSINIILGTSIEFMWEVEGALHPGAYLPTLVRFRKINP